MSARLLPAETKILASLVALVLDLQLVTARGDFYLLLPAHIIPGLTSCNGIPVIRASVPFSMVALAPYQLPDPIKELEQ